MSRVSKSAFVCQSCGYVASKWFGQCPGCEAWHTMVEERPQAAMPFIAQEGEHALKLSGIQCDLNGHRIGTDSREMDRVLGGGLVSGGVALIGGEPGIGKSTLLLQILCNLAAHNVSCLYVSGEESLSQIKARATRLHGTNKDSKTLQNTSSSAAIENTTSYAEPWLLSSTRLEHIQEEATRLKPQVMVIDSVQTLICQDISSAPGSVAQVREATFRMVQFAKAMGVSLFLVGHVTKDGAIAGPRLLEHLVDTVLYFEGDRGQSFRILRTVKNRYGPTHEIGVFEMTSGGLQDVDNPSHFFLSERQQHVFGSVITPCLEGTRPILVEIQALVTRSYLVNPRRTSTGFDSNRLAMLLAVCEKYLNLRLYDQDVFINVAGGFRITETAADLGVVMAILSSFKAIPLPSNQVIFGEIGLTGELRPVSQWETRMNEAVRMGFKTCLMPFNPHAKNTTAHAIFVKRIEEAVKACLNKA
ncbi:MAG: DNA repair protein RadA [Dissulfuribacterales bacterium]